MVSPPGCRSIDVYILTTETESCNVRANCGEGIRGIFLPGWWLLGKTKAPPPPLAALGAAPDILLFPPFADSFSGYAKPASRVQVFLRSKFNQYFSPGGLQCRVQFLLTCANVMFACDFYQENANELSPKFSLLQCSICSDRAEILIRCYGFLCQIGKSSTRENQRWWSFLPSKRAPENGQSKGS